MFISLTILIAVVVDIAFAYLLYKSHKTTIASILKQEKTIKDMQFQLNKLNPTLIDEHFAKQATIIKNLSKLALAEEEQLNKIEHKIDLIEAKDTKKPIKSKKAE